MPENLLVFRVRPNWNAFTYSTKLEENSDASPFGGLTTAKED